MWGEEVVPFRRVCFRVIISSISGVFFFLHFFHPWDLSSNSASLLFTINLMPCFPPFGLCVCESLFSCLISARGFFGTIFKFSEVGNQFNPWLLLFADFFGVIFNSVIITYDSWLFPQFFSCFMNSNDTIYIAIVFRFAVLNLLLVCTGSGFFLFAPLNEKFPPFKPAHLHQSARVGHGSSCPAVSKLGSSSFMCSGKFRLRYIMLHFPVPGSFCPLIFWCCYSDFPMDFDDRLFYHWSVPLDLPFFVLFSTFGFASEFQGFFVAHWHLPFESSFGCHCRNHWDTDIVTLSQLVETIRSAGRGGGVGESAPPSQRPSYSKSTTLFLDKMGGIQRRLTWSGGGLLELGGGFLSDISWSSQQVDSTGGRGGERGSGYPSNCPVSIMS